MFELLDKESEEQLRYLTENNKRQTNFTSSTFEYLYQNGFVKAIKAPTMSSPNLFIFQDLTHKGKIYFEEKKKHTKEKRKLTRRDWIMMISSIILSGIVSIIVSLLVIKFS